MPRSLSSRQRPASSFTNVHTEEGVGDIWSDLADNHSDNTDGEHEESTRTHAFVLLRKLPFMLLQCWKVVSPRGYMPVHAGESQGYPSDLECSSMFGEEAELFVVYQRLRVLSLTVLVASSIFWTWANYNTSKMEDGNKDLGIYSFASTGVMALWVLYRTRTGKKPVAHLITRILFMASHLCVTANYGLGLLYALTIGTSIYPLFATYCSSFMVLWFAVAVYGRYLMQTLSRHESDLAVPAEHEHDQDSDDSITSIGFRLD